MKVRKIKKEDIKVGVKVYRKGFFGSVDMRYIEEVSSINTNGCYFKTGEFITEKSLIYNYLLLEEEQKTNDTKVMTYVGGFAIGLKNGKNYNVKDTGEDVYELIGDDGNKRVELKEFFVEPSEYRNKNNLNLSIFFDNYNYEMSEKLREMLRLGENCRCVTKEINIKEGTKHDQNKLKPSLLFNDFPHAIEEVLKVLKFGAEKYSEGNWLKVDNGIERYRNAAHRHMLAQEEFDDESGLLHLAHEATSVLMMLELKLREMKDAK